MSVRIVWTDVPEDCENGVAEKRLFEELGECDLGGVPEDGMAKNFLIKADNLPVLKDFAKKGVKVDFIYIDPPYNTGNDFIYKDNFSEDYWLSFMNRRLLVAREILKSEGVIFIAIDQNELYALKLLCDSIFGAKNFVNDFMWLHGKGKKDKWSRTLQQHTLCYAKDKSKLLPFEEIEFSQWAMANADNDVRGNWFSGSISFSEKRSNKNHRNYYSITSPSGKVWTRQWLVSKEEMDKLIEENMIFWGVAPDFNGVPRKKIFNGTATKVIPKNIISQVQSTRAAQNHLNEILCEKWDFDTEGAGADTECCSDTEGAGVDTKCCLDTNGGALDSASNKKTIYAVFENPKPVDLILHFLNIVQLPENAVVLDFFAGSGTTFEAVCELNNRKKSNCKCILIQKEENNIAEICKRRCQKVAAAYKQEINFINF